MQTKYKVSRVLSDRINVEVFNAKQIHQLPIDNAICIEKIVALRFKMSYLKSLDIIFVL